MKLATKINGKGVKKMAERKLGVLTEDKFNLLKLLKINGVKNAEIARIIGAKPKSINVWGMFETWSDYCEYKKEQAKKQMEKSHQQTQKPQTVVIIPKKEYDQLANYMTMASRIIVKHFDK